MKSIAFLWDNFGPMHDDRVGAVANAYGERARVAAIELFGRSDTYAWNNAAVTDFEKITLFAKGDWKTVSTLRIAADIIRHCRRLGSTHVFMCHYERPAMFLAAAWLRLFGVRVFTMGCSKFDDYDRYINREWLKRFFFLPYQGAISSGIRARDYMRLMGIARDRVATEYNTLSIARIRALSGAIPAPGRIPYDDRHFTIVARFVPKKNLAMAIDAYALYCKASPNPRQLHLCGSGPLENELRRKVEMLELTDKVVFRGFLQSDGVAAVLGRTVALLLPSVEEQFGNVVIEAQAMGLPVILSDNCGARDKLIRSGVNGFIIEPDNPEGLAFHMSLIGGDRALWQRMCVSATSFADKGDVARFAEAVGTLAET